MRIWVWLFVPAAMLAQVNVPYERIRDANQEPGNWLTYSRDYSGRRYSPLDQINAGNVSRLHLAWMRQVDETDTFETSPIAVDGTLFITEPPNIVEALAPLPAVIIEGPKSTASFVATGPSVFSSIVAGDSPVAEAEIIVVPSSVFGLKSVLTPL